MSLLCAADAIGRIVQAAGATIYAWKTTPLILLDEQSALHSEFSCATLHSHYLQYPY